MDVPADVSIDLESPGEIGSRSDRAGEGGEELGKGNTQRQQHGLCFALEWLDPDLKFIACFCTHCVHCSHGECFS